MRLFYYGKDGGKDSTVWGFWLCEFKSLFSIVLLKFENGSRDTYHNHAFNSVSWVLSGQLDEYHLNGAGPLAYFPSSTPIITRRSTFHKVISKGRTWVLSFRGPWTKTWDEYNPETHEYVKLTESRKPICYSRDAILRS